MCAWPGPFNLISVFYVLSKDKSRTIFVHRRSLFNTFWIILYVRSTEMVNWSFQICLTQAQILDERLKVNFVIGIQEGYNLEGIKTELSHFWSASVGSKSTSLNWINKKMRYQKFCKQILLHTSLPLCVHLLSMRINFKQARFHQSNMWHLLVQSTLNINE